MTLPAQAPGAYAMAFALWGMATGEWLWAGAAIAGLELPRILRRTFEIDERGFRMAWLLCLFLLWAVGINAWLENNRLEALRGMQQWLPFTLLPVMLVSAWATRPGIPVSALLILLKGRYTLPSVCGVRPVVPAVDPFFPCVWLVLLSTSYQAPGKWFFWGCVLTIAWVFLHPCKGRTRWAMRAWLVAAAGLGLVLHTGVFHLYRVLDTALLAAGRHGLELEASRSMTRIGSVSKIKNSPAIRWRLARETGPNPSYLVDGTFNAFRGSIWGNSGHRLFQPVPPAAGSGLATQWKLQDQEGPADQRLRIRGRPTVQWTVLPLAVGSRRIERLPATRVERNGLGVVRADSEVPVLEFTVESGRQPTLQPPPGAEDLGVPDELEPALRSIEQEIGLHHLAPADAVAALRSFFLMRFSYSRKPGGASLEDFLVRTRRGHCEYFATAAALLLRSAGIPARYQTGFAVSEFHADRNQWVVRGTHAHAWAIAWINGAWQTVDPTPPAWLESDQDRVPAWQGLLDWWDERWMAFEVWRETSDPAALVAESTPWVLTVVILYTAIRFWLGRRKPIPAPPSQPGCGYTGEGLESPWARLRPMVERACGPRPDGLPTLAWIDGMAGWPDPVRHAACSLVRDHYRRCFGPNKQMTHGDGGLDQAADRLRRHLGGQQ